jgi:hypothetical protein
MWRRARASGWSIVAKSMAVAMVERGSANLACENKPQLVQARTVTTSRAFEIAPSTGIFYARHSLARRAHAICRLAPIIAGMRLPRNEVPGNA